MKPITAADLERLGATPTPPCISLYLTARRRRLGVEDRVRARALFADAFERLAALYHRRDVERLLVPAVHAVERAWPPRARSVAIFRSPDELLACTLPVEVPDVAVVSARFHTQPLAAFLSRPQRFFVLGLSTKSTRLYAGTPERLDEVVEPTLPTSVADALGPQRGRPRYVGVHGGGSGGVHRRGAAEVQADRKERLRRYFRALDATVSRQLRGSGAPLVLAGVRHLQALYRSVSRYPVTLDAGLEGAVNAFPAHELHERAWALVVRWDDARPRARADPAHASSPAL